MLKREAGVDAELVEGSRGEFTVNVNGQCVAKKGWLGFPADDKILAAVKDALAG